MADLKLGKLPARPYPKKFSLAALVDTSGLPPIPDAFGYETVIDNFGMLGNDAAGDCVFAGGAHETMLLNKLAGKTVLFSEASVLSDYSALTGYDPNDASTDQGTDVQDAARYRRVTGLLDANGKRHKTTASLALEPGNLEHLWAAFYLFKAVGIGLKLPVSAMDQFRLNQPWDVVTGSPIEGGHYVSLLAKRNMLRVVTWATGYPMTLNFFSKYCDEARVYISPEDMIDQKSPDGFDYATLQNAVRHLS